MLCKKIRSCLFSTIVLMPCFAFSGTDTWNGTTSSDLNIPSNWLPPGIPSSSDQAVFDNTISNISLTPTASTDFSIDSFSFDHSASPFSFTFNNCVLTFTGTGLAGTPTNTTIVSNNIDNPGFLSNAQVVFSSSSTFGSANMTVTNSGHASDSASGVSSSYLSAPQVKGLNTFSMSDNSQLSAINSGVDSSTGNGGNNVGSLCTRQKMI